MSLKVLVSSASAFPTQVEEGLRRICACFAVHVNPATGVVTTGSMVCDCYCQHPAGCNLIADLIDDPRTIVIGEAAADTSGYENTKDWLSWSPKDYESDDKDTCGGSIIPAAIALAHELVHARHENFTEAETVRGENQVRLERCLPLRTSYGDPIPDYDVGTIDASIWPEYGCDCSATRIGCFGLLARVFCVLQSASCILKRLLGLAKRSTTGGRPMPHNELPPIEDPVLRERIDRALWIRQRSEVAHEFDHLAPVVPPPTWQVDLEAIGLDGGFRVLRLMVLPDEVRLITNFTLGSAAPPWLGVPGDSLVGYQIRTQSMVNRVTAVLQRMQFNDGTGGQREAHDGAAHFLRLQGPGRSGITALYYYTFPATSSLWYEPAGIDGPRWRAIRDVYELWKDIMTDPALVHL